MTPREDLPITPAAISNAELTIANVVALLLPLDVNVLRAVSDEHARQLAAIPHTDPARSFVEAGAKASAAVVACREAMAEIDPPSAKIDSAIVRAASGLEPPKT